MAARVTPQLIAAGAIVVVALAVCLPPLFSGGGDYPVLVTNPRVAGQGGAVLPASLATDPVVPPFARLPDGNPFTLRKNGVVRGPRIGVPPPPPLTPPSPPVLPLPEVR
jgi:hypothetical protein